MKRALPVLGLVYALAIPTTVGAEAEWWDGTPPPQDFGLQQTAPPSATSAYSWLRSADGGEAVEASWDAAGVDVSLLDGLAGGVAQGMTIAIQARPTK